MGADDREPLGRLPLGRSHPYDVHMTRLMEQAIERLRAIPENQQDRLAEFLLHELAEEERWAATTHTHRDKLTGLIESVLADDAAGGCEPLDPERL